ncbi:MAG TPA: hypothetical protein VL251_01250, partial [Thermomonas sp.]|nr:hypothetical protein [Thermomonas sp.]
MTARPAPPPPAAVAAYLRGVERRARLLAQVQAGGQDPGDHALAAVARVFAAEAGRWPIAQWPREYWRLLLAAPALRGQGAAGAGPLPGVARLPAPQRAAVLLQLVSALDEADIAAVLGTTVADYQHRIRASLPADALGAPDIDVWRAWQAAAQRALAETGPLPASSGPAPADPASSVAAALPAADRPPHARWLWLGVATCVLAFAAALLLWPDGRTVVQGWLAPIRRDLLPPAAAPRARFDPADAAGHPDRDLLAAPGEAALARALPLLAWLVGTGQAVDEVAALPPAAPAREPVAALAAR